MTEPSTRPFVFLDRDGTLIEDREYAHLPADYAPIPGAYAAVAALRVAGYGVVVVTNQSGIGRGLFSPAEYAAFETLLLRDFAAHAAALDGCYHCPHAPDAGCACRKPGTALALRAAREHAIDLARSWVIGDKDSDVALARGLGARAVLVRTGQGERHRSRVPLETPVARDLVEAVSRYVLADRATQPAR